MVRGRERMATELLVVACRTGRNAIKTAESGYMSLRVVIKLLFSSSVKALQFSSSLFLYFGSWPLSLCLLMVLRNQCCKSLMAHAKNYTI